MKKNYEKAKIDLPWAVYQISAGPKAEAKAAVPAKKVPGPKEDAKSAEKK